MARLKKVVSASEVAELYVRRSQSQAHTPSRNFSFFYPASFENDQVTRRPNTLHLFENLYSYSTIVATRCVFPNPTKTPVMFITQYRYSVTTSRQLRELNVALKKSQVNVAAIYVPGDVEFTAINFEHGLLDMWEQLIYNAREMWGKSLRARSRYDIYIHEGTDFVNNANLILHHFSDRISVPSATLEDIEDTHRFYKAQLKLRGVK